MELRCYVPNLTGETLSYLTANVMVTLHESSSDRGLQSAHDGAAYLH